MKNRIIRIIAICLVFAFLCAVAGIIFHMSRSRVPVTLYLLDKQQKNLITKDTDISYADPTYIPEKIIKKLQGRGGIPKATLLNYVSFDSADSITVDFTKDFLTEDYRINVLRTYAVVKSICSTSQFIGISRVKVTTDEKPIMTSDGKALGHISDSSINLLNSDNKIVYSCELYFKDKSSGIFKSEKRSIDALGSLEYAAVQALIDGPYLKNLDGVFPKNTRLISAEVFDGTCYVNLAPLSKTADINDIETALTYTLTAFEGIDNVKILIDGLIQNF